MNYIIKVYGINSICFLFWSKTGLKILKVDAEKFKNKKAAEEVISSDGFLISRKTRIVEVTR